MGSVPFDGGDECQPSTSNGKNCKLSRMLLDGCEAINHSSIPRKLRTAMKKRSREPIAAPLLISRKQQHVSTAVDARKKDGAKKSKMNMKQVGRITKDEEEVAETLYALAGFFYDASKADRPGCDEKPEEEGSSMNAAGAEEIKSQSLETPQLEFFSSKQAVTPNAYGGQSESNPCFGLRPLASTLGTTQNGEQEIHLDQVTVSGFQHGKNFSSIDDKDIDSFLSPNTIGMTCSEKEKSCPSAKIHSLLESTNFSSQPCAIEEKITTEKPAKKAPESNTSWKRCAAHIYISRLIKILQISDKKEELPRQSDVSIHNQMPRINGRSGDAHLSAMHLFPAHKVSSDIPNNILSDKRPSQDQQMTSETSSLSSAKQGYDFLSLGTGPRGLDTGISAKGEGCSREPPRQFHISYLQSQNNSMLSSLPQHGYSSSFHGHNSALAAQQVQLPQYRSSKGRTGQQMDSQQQRWAAQLQVQHNTARGGVPRLPDWRNGVDSASVLNYAHSLFPHLHAALGSKYQQLSPSQQAGYAHKI